MDGVEIMRTILPRASLFRKPHPMMRVMMICNWTWTQHLFQESNLLLALILVPLTVVSQSSETVNRKSLLMNKVTTPRPPPYLTPKKPSWLENLLTFKE